MIKAIVYESKTGHTKEYAQMLGDKLKLPYYPRNEAPKHLNKNDEIIYMGWIEASVVQGYKTTNSKYNIKCVIAVGFMPPSESNLERIKKGSVVTEDLFYLRGGLDLNKLKGFQKIIIKLMKHIMPLFVKKENNPLADLFENGGYFVKEENLNEVLKYLKKK